MRCHACGIDHECAPDWENMKCPRYFFTTAVEALCHLIGVPEPVVSIDAGPLTWPELRPMIEH